MNLLNANDLLWQGGVTISYTARDSAGNTCVGSVKVSPTDQPPVAAADAATVTAGGSVSIDVLANDTDPEGGALSVTAATAETGSVTVEADGILVYTAPAGFSGTDTVTYEITDAGGNVTPGIVTVAVEAAAEEEPAPVDQPPSAAADAATVTAGGSVTIDVLANDTDPEGGALSVTAATAETGSVTVEADGALVYTAPAGFSGTDTISYTIADPAGNTSEGQVTVGVDPVPDAPPVAVDDTAAVATAGGSVSIDVLANDTDPEGGALSVTAATAETGSVTVEADGILVYTAPAGFSGTDTISYTIADPAGNTDDGQVTVTVTPLQLVIDEKTTVGDFAVEASHGEIAVTIIEPTAYAGRHVIQTSDLAEGPINLVPARIGGGSATGDTLTAAPGIWAGDESHGAIAFSQQWLQADQPIAGATGVSHVIQAGDATQGLHYVRQATNTAGTRSIAVEALAATPAAGGSFVEQGVRFSAPSKLVRNADLAPADSHNVVYFVSLILHSTGRQGILRQTDIGNGVEIWDGARLQFRANMPGTSRTADTLRSLVVGQRASFIAAASGSGSSTVMQLFSRFAGESGWTAEKTDSNGTGAIDLTFGGFSVGGRHGSGGHDLNATVYRIACWSDVTLDLGDPTTFTRFLKADGTLENPEVSRTRYGVPRVDLFGPAADYAAGINRGTAGNFDSVQGTFTNA